MARRVMKVLGWAAGVLLVGVLLVVAGVYVLLQTQTGHDFVLRSVLAQAPRFVQGEVQVGGVRSDGLLGGFVLSDVRITDERGRPFLEA
jgi:autotransporter translocation and assembly factor TamB